MRKMKLKKAGMWIVAVAIVMAPVVSAAACDGGNCGGACSGQSWISTDKVKENLEANLPPAAQVVKVTPSPVSGIYEVLTGDNRIVYTDSSGRYVFAGNLIDVQQKVVLSKPPKKEIKFSSLPLADAVKTGEGDRKIAVFTDPDCPYCRKLEGELAKLDGVEVYNFLYPLPIHPQAKGKAVSAWCSDDRVEAFKTILAGKTLKSRDCDNPIERNLNLGSRLGVKGTPFIILDNSEVIEGYVPVDRLKAALDS